MNNLQMAFAVLTVVSFIAIYILLIYIFKRLRYHDLCEEGNNALFMDGIKIKQDQHKRIKIIEEFIASREPCTICSHHRYRQKTLHNGVVK